ncbi:hypothetical protein FACS189494_10360 [Spirochaetia bacterium]|nr:hypothetical protein FACS189494_10360 [Spirochaetia bacterium]
MVRNNLLKLSTFLCELSGTRAPPFVISFTLPENDEIPIYTCLGGSLSACAPALVEEQLMKKNTDKTALAASKDPKQIFAGTVFFRFLWFLFIITPLI